MTIAERLNESRARRTSWFCPRSWCGEENPGERDHCTACRASNPNAEVLEEWQL